MLSPDFVGREYPGSGTHEIHPYSIGAFAQAINDENPVYFDLGAAQELGYPNLVAPPTFLITIALGESRRALNDPELGLDWSRVVHGDQRFTHARPVVAGDVLSCLTTIEAIKSVAGNDFVTMRSDFADHAGLQVASTWSMLVVRGPAS